MSKVTLLVEVESCMVTPVTVEADSASDAVDRVMRGEGEPGQSWYRQLEWPLARPLPTNQGDPGSG